MSISSTSPTKPRLVVIGSGWAGFYIAQYIDQSAYAVTIISPRRTSAYTPLLASAAVGLFNFYLAEDSVRAKSRNQIKYIKASVLDIDFTLKSCRCAPAFDDDAELAKSEFEIPYDILVIAPGCQPNTFGTPGVAEYALFMKNVSDAMKVRKTLFDLLEKASLPNTSPERAKELLHIAIVGGGPTGIELTAELDDLAKHELRDLYPEVAGLVRISVYDVAPNILGGYEKRLYEYANERLVSRNVNVETNARIDRVDADALHLKDKGRVPCGMLIWATGNKSVSLTEKVEARYTEKGLKRILTDNHLCVFKPSTDKADDGVYSDVFALGDAADIDGASLPTTAEVAVQKAKYLVDHFNNKHARINIQDKPFSYEQKQLVSYIGQRDGVIAGKGDREGWTGKSAWLAWRSGSIMWTRSWRNRIVILITWGLNAIFGKEIARM